MLIALWVGLVEVQLSRVDQGFLHTSPYKGRLKPNSNCEVLVVCVHCRSAALPNEGETWKVPGKSSHLLFFSLFFSLLFFYSHTVWHFLLKTERSEFFIYGLLFRVCGFQWFLTQ